MRYLSMMDSRYLDYISEAIKHLYPITKQHIEGILNDLKTYITDRLDVNVNQLPNIKTPNKIITIIPNTILYHPNTLKSCFFM